MPIPHRYEEFNNRLTILKNERDVFRRAYRKIIASISEEPIISPDVLCALSDCEKDLVIAALDSEGLGEEIFCINKRRSVELNLTHHKKQVHEQHLLVKAMQDVSKAQALLYDFMREQTALENLGDEPNRRKENKACAFSLLKMISEIGNGNCLFPPKEIRMEKEHTFETVKGKEMAEKRIRDRSRKREDFRYHGIRDCEALRDDSGNLVIPMSLMRSLAFLHLRYNNLHVQKAMDAESIPLAEHSGEELLTLARRDLKSIERTALIKLSAMLREWNEPEASDFSEYLQLIAEIPPLPRLILTLLHRDVAAAHPRECAGEVFGREDLVEQYRKGGDIVRDDERAVLMRELTEYLTDYMEALAESERDSEKTDGFTVRNAFRVYKLLRENARKYLFQSGVHYIYLTGSDHGVKHLIQGNVRFTTQIARNLRWSAQDRVCLRQMAVDHDLGYTHAAMQRFSMHEEGIPLNNGYYELFKDHPLYSSTYFETHRPEYEEYFGKQGAKNIGLSILDHSEVKGHLRDLDPAKRLQALFSRMDCLAVSADLKNAPAFMHPKVLVAMSKAFEAIEYLRDVDQRMGKLWKKNRVQSDEYRWLATVQGSLRTVAGKVKEYLLGLGMEIYNVSVMQQAYYRAVHEHYDPFNPRFPVQRDFGSNAISFEGVSVYSTEERDFLTARLNIKQLLFSISEYFGGEQGASFATSALKKLLADFGGFIRDSSMVVEAFEELSLVSEGPFSEEDVEMRTDGGMGHAQWDETHMSFEFIISKTEEHSPLIDYMKSRTPSLKMMRGLLNPEIDMKTLQLLLKEIASKLQNKKMKTFVMNEDWEEATEHFIARHFALPKSSTL